MPTELVVIQHAEKVRSPGDPGLTDRGHRQAAEVAAWLAQTRADITQVWSSPLRRALETAAPIAAALDTEVRVDARLRERMNWDDPAAITAEDFMAEWQRASRDRTHQPPTGDSSDAAAERFIAALIEIASPARDVAVAVVAHGGVTVDTLRTIAGDDAVHRTNPDLLDGGVPSCAITRG